MRSFTKSLLTGTVFFISACLWGQEVYRMPDAEPVARLSYDTSPVVWGVDSSHICIAVSHNGEYRVERSLITGKQRLRGKLTKEQFEQLKALLRSDEFRALSGHHGGLIRKDFETFTAEISAKWQDENSSQRLQWLNADSEKPFPASMAKVVDWLKHSQLEGGESFAYAEYPDVCPRGGLRLVQPSIAENHRP
jgi:hypothetical protein